MKNIALLRKKMDDTAQLLHSYEKQLKKEPTDFALRSTTQSLRARLNQIQSQYQQAIEAKK